MNFTSGVNLIKTFQSKITLLVSLTSSVELGELRHNNKVNWLSEKKRVYELQFSGLVPGACTIKCFTAVIIVGS